MYRFPIVSGRTMSEAALASSTKGYTRDKRKSNDLKGYLKVFGYKFQKSN